MSTFVTKQELVSLSLFQRKELVSDRLIEVWWNRLPYLKGGTICAATGVGKTRLALKVIDKKLQENPNLSVLVVVPTIKLRDEDWPQEIKKWGYEHLLPHLKIICFASASKIKDKVFDLLVLDEGHHLTSLSALVEVNNQIKEILSLTATPPSDDEPYKLELFERLCPVLCVYGLKEAIEDEIVADFVLEIVEASLDNRRKYIPAGTKDKPFLQHEEGYNDYLDKTVLKFQKLGKADPKMRKLADIWVNKRKTFLYNVASKIELVKLILSTDPWFNTNRHLLFTGSILSADTLCPNTYHSGENCDPLDYQRFNEGEISRLAVVDGANEGANFYKLDGALIKDIKSSPRVLVQRIGRTIRYREDIPGFKARVVITYLKGTQEEHWLKKALVHIPRSKIIYTSANNYLNARTD